MPTKRHSALLEGGNSRVPGHRLCERTWQSPCACCRASRSGTKQRPCFSFHTSPVNSDIRLKETLQGKHRASLPSARVLEICLAALQVGDDAQVQTPSSFMSSIYTPAPSNSSMHVPWPSRSARCRAVLPSAVYLTLGADVGCAARVDKQSFRVSRPSVCSSVLSSMNHRHR